MSHTYHPKYRVTNIDLTVMQEYLKLYRCGGGTKTTVEDLYKMSGPQYQSIMIEISERPEYIELQSKMSYKPSRIKGVVGAITRLLIDPTG